MPARNKAFALLRFIVAGLVLALICVWIVHRQMRGFPAKPHGLLVIANPPAQDVASGTAAQPGVSDMPARKLVELAGRLGSAPDATAARQQLESMRKTLASMPTNSAAAAIRQVLDSKVDAPTHLGFRLKSDGFLETAPTLRTFLLDELARIDPIAAADYAKVVLAGMDSPDEWAIALRNLARGDPSPAGRALLEEKTGDLLHSEQWQQDPSTGYLEAFDIAVYLGGTNLMSPLTDLLRQQQNPAVAHAAFLALDRLVINQPASLLNGLAADQALLAGRERTRADYFARADVRDPQQRQVLESYLLNPLLASSELDAFASIYPNANYMVSPNLLTSTATPDHMGLAERDRESLRVVKEWLADQRFAARRAQLEQIEQRLAGFISQAGGP